MKRAAHADMVSDDLDFLQIVSQVAESEIDPDIVKVNNSQRDTDAMTGADARCDVARLSCVRRRWSQWQAASRPSAHAFAQRCVALTLVLLRQERSCTQASSSSFSARIS